MFKVILVAITVAYFMSTASAVSLPPVNTNIVNSNKAQFIGSMIVSQTNTTSTQVIRQAVTPINAQFKDCDACNAWAANLESANPGLIAAFVGSGNGIGASLPASWAKYGYVGYIGGCSDITTGASCAAPE